MTPEFLEELRDNLEGSKKHDACDDWLIENRHKMARLLLAGPSLAQLKEWESELDSVSWNRNVHIYTQGEIQKVVLQLEQLSTPEKIECLTKT